MKKISFGAMLIGMGIVSVGATQSAEACSVAVGRGWASGAGNGTIVMAKGAKTCGDRLWTDPAAGLPVTSIQVTSAPANGRVTTKGNSFQYAPKPGFVGQDSFSLSGAGKAQGGAAATLSGRITVTVQ